MNEVKAVFEQSLGGKVISRVTVEWPGIEDHALANTMSISLIEAAIAAVKSWAAVQAEAK